MNGRNAVKLVCAIVNTWKLCQVLKVENVFDMEAARRVVKRCIESGPTELRDAAIIAAFTEPETEKIQ